MQAADHPRNRRPEISIVGRVLPTPHRNLNEVPVRTRTRYKYRKEVIETGTGLPLAVECRGVVDAAGNTYVPYK